MNNEERIDNEKWIRRLLRRLYLSLRYIDKENDEEIIASNLEYMERSLREQFRELDRKTGGTTLIQISTPRDRKRG